MKFLSNYITMMKMAKLTFMGDHNSIIQELILLVQTLKMIVTHSIITTLKVVIYQLSHLQLAKALLRVKNQARVMQSFKT